MKAEINLLKVVSGKGFEASIVTTYNAYLPFYEQVVLRHLVASGCRYNILLMDARHYAAALASPHARPQLAGHSYTLVPVASSSAFHPKILMLVGRQKGTLCVGSHNTTVSGFGHNRELTTRIVFNPKSDPPAAALCLRAWEFVRGLVANNESVPQAVQDAIAALPNLAPWMKSKNAATESDSLEFLGSAPEATELFPQLEPLLPEDASRVLVLGPFFDGGLALLRSLKEALPRAQLVVGLDPASADIAGPQAAPGGTKFVDASALATGSGYLHAKAIYVESAGNDDILVIGSANPTKSGWLTTKGGRNVEAVLVRRGLAAKETSLSLGFTGLLDAKSIESAEWSSISERLSSSAKPDRQTGATGTGTVVAVEDGFLVSGAPAETSDGTEVHLLDSRSRTVSTIHWTAAVDHSGALLLPYEDETAGLVRFLSFQTAGAEPVLAHVHHLSAIRGLSRSSRQNQFRAAMASLESSEPDLQGVMALVQRLIFSDASESPRRETPLGKPAREKESKEEELGPLIVSLRERKEREGQRLSRALRSGDLASVLDLLIYQLGLGLESLSQGLDSRGRSEEEQVGEDDEDQDAEISEKNLFLCAKKVRTIVNRMVRQFEHAREGKSPAEHTVFQLVAVLAVLRHLRTCDTRAPWRKPGATLVPLTQRQKLLAESMAYLFGETDLHARAVDRIGGEDSDELSRLRGLLLWLAWDCELPLDGRSKFNEEPFEARERLQARSTLAALSSLTALDETAAQEARNSVLGVVNPESRGSAGVWLARSLTWGEQLAEAIIDEAAPPEVDELNTGDVVMARKWSVPRVVLGQSGATVRLTDFDEPTESRSWSRGYVRALPAGTLEFHSSLYGV